MPSAFPQQFSEKRPVGAHAALPDSFTTAAAAASGYALWSPRPLFVLPAGARMPAGCRGPMNMSVLSVKGRGCAYLCHAALPEAWGKHREQFNSGAG